MKKLLAILCAASTFLLSATPANANEPIKIAFVDTGNTGRSLTAESLANVIISKQKLSLAVISRAVDMDPFDTFPEANASTLLAKRGIDVSAHRAVQLTQNDIRHADIILTMTAKHKNKVIDIYPEAKDKIYTLSEYATGESSDVADAWGKPMEVYIEMFNQVEKYITPALQKALKK